MPGLSPRTGIYIRVSTEEQAKEGYSTNAQAEKLKQYATAKDWKIYDYYVDDGISGKNIKDRPEINRLLNDVKSGNVENVLVYKIDRLTRSTKNLIELVDLFNYYNCAFNSLMESIDTNSATGRMFLKIIGIFAEFERENLAERVAFGYEQKTREGNYTNTHGVYGYDYIQGEGKILVNPEEKKTVNQIFQWYIDGISMTKICKRLIENQIPTKRRGKWCQSTIQSILTNPLYIGKIRYDVKGSHNKSFIVDGEHEPIIREELFNHAEQIISTRQKYQSRKYPSENSIFAGALFCGNCEARIGSTQHKRYGNYGELYVNYYCYNRKNGNCDCKIVSQNRLEKEFIKYISNIANFSTEGIELEEQDNGAIERLEELKGEFAKIDKRLEEIKKFFVQEKITFDEYKEFSKILEEKHNILNAEYSKLNIEEQPKTVNIELIKQYIGDIKANWEYLNNAEKSQFIHKFISRMVIYSKEKELHIQDLEFYDMKSEKEISLKKEI